jgi:hypothetical protein
VVLPVYESKSIAAAKCQHRELKQDNTGNWNRVVLGNRAGFEDGLLGFETGILGVWARNYSIVSGSTFCYSTE